MMLDSFMGSLSRNLELCNKLEALNNKEELEGVDVALIDALMEELVQAQNDLASLIGDSDE